MQADPVPTVRLAGFYFAYYAALGAFLPFWSLFLKQRGQSAAAISVLISLWYATRIVAPNTWSWLAARSPRPIRWLRFGAAAALASFAIFLLPLEFGGLFIAMCAFCFCYNAIMPQFESLTLSHLGKRSENYGPIRAWGSIGFVLVVSTFGLLFDHLSLAWLPLLMLPLFAAIFLSTLMNNYAADYHIENDDHHDFGARLKQREVLVFFVVALLMAMSFGPYYTFFSLYLEENGYHASALGTYWDIGILAEIGVFYFSARIFARFDPVRVLQFSLLLGALRWCVTALFPQNLSLMTLAQLTHAITFAASFAACIILLARYFPGRLNGHAQGVFYGFSSGIGGVLGALLAGQAWRIGGGQLAFLFGAGISAVAFIVAMIGMPASRAATSQPLTIER